MWTVVQMSLQCLEGYDEGVAVVRISWRNVTNNDAAFSVIGIRWANNGILLNVLV